jgi:hypothetical protein
VPAILLEPIAVDKTNIVSTVIKDGFQKMENVYKNVPRNQWPQTDTTAQSSASPSVSASASPGASPVTNP